jgi:hypothetical protein
MMQHSMNAVVPVSINISCEWCGHQRADHWQ